MFTTTVADQIASVIMSSPPVNALSEAWLAGLSRQLDNLAARRDWKVLLLRSDQKVFCAGADLKEIKARFEAVDGPDRAYSYVATIQRIYARIESLAQVTIAELSGAALGGGFELALSCDLRIAANEAKLGLPEVRLGLIPGGGGTQRLTQLVGKGLASRLILGAEVIDGVTAQTLGLVQWSFPRADLPARTAEIAKRLAALPAAALTAAKRTIAAASDPDRGGFRDEIEWTRELQTNPETRTLVAAFLAGARP
jgi:enoyl-CoA hydratase